ncbi:MAG: hypothetical protein PF542_03290 [Nanoarchaeota archaeon]|jgi:hypothetical protein|nr:hypothetical protein [Nanoarchaeota archaeon]
MKNILIIGSLPKTDSEIELYNSIINICKIFSKTISSAIDTAKFQGTEEDRYNRAFRKVREADLITGEQSYPSTGQGMEIREAHILDKPLIAIAKEKSKISGLVKSCPITKDIIYYKNLNDLNQKLKESISKLI